MSAEVIGYSLPDFNFEGDDGPFTAIEERQEIDTSLVPASLIDDSSSTSQAETTEECFSYNQEATEQECESSDERSSTVIIPNSSMTSDERQQPSDQERKLESMATLLDQRQQPQPQSQQQTSNTLTTPFTVQKRLNPFEGLSINPFVTNQQQQTGQRLANPFMVKTVNAPQSTITPVINRAPAPAAATVARNPFLALINQQTLSTQPTATSTPPQLPPPLSKEEEEKKIEAEVKKRLAQRLDSEKNKRRRKQKSKTNLDTNYKVVNDLDRAAKSMIPEGHILVETTRGSFIVPDYERMSLEEQQRRRNSWDLQYEDLSAQWKRKIKMPTEEESLTNIDVRYQEIRKYIQQNNSCNFPKLFMIVCWAGIQVAAQKMGINADGYFISQLRLLDIYESKMLRMSEMKSFGEDWPWWIHAIILSGVNLIMMAALNYKLKGKASIELKQDLMRSVSQFISGKTATPLPGSQEVQNDDDPVGNVIGTRSSGINVTNIINAGISSFFGSGDDDDDEEDEEEERASRRRRKRGSRRGGGGGRSSANNNSSSKEKRKAPPKVEVKKVSRDEIPEEI
jgi:hypothetical protein